MKGISPIFNDFLNYLETVKNLSSSTVKVYFYEIRIFMRFLLIRWNEVDGYHPETFKEIDVSKVDVDELNRVSVRDIYAYLAFSSQHLNNHSRALARKVSSLRSFFSYMHDKVHVIDEDPTKGIDTPKIEKNLPKYLTLAETKKLLDTIDQEENEDLRLRDKTIVLLFLNTGLRVSEMSSLNLDSINFENQSLRVLGKGNKERTVYLNKAANKALLEYVKKRPKVSNDEEALFISQKKNRMSTRAIQYMVEKYVNLAGFDSSEITVHKLRHTAATLMYQYGQADIRSIQEILGHENVATTQIYTHVNDESLRRAVDDNPLANILDDEGSKK